MLGKSLTEPLVAKRRDGLLQQIYDLGIELPDGAIEVIAADGLARWVENYPALAADPLLGGIGPVGQTFHQWASSNRHASNWTTSDSREGHIDDIRKLITGDGQRDLHIDGVSGLGKTRLVMEALRGQDYEQLVVYAQAADQFPSDVLPRWKRKGERP